MGVGVSCCLRSGCHAKAQVHITSMAPCGMHKLAQPLTAAVTQPAPFCRCCLQRNMVREGTVFLLDALAGDKPEEAALQTKVLEINLVTNPQVSLTWSCL